MVKKEILGPAVIMALIAIDQITKYFILQSSLSVSNFDLFQLWDMQTSKLMRASILSGAALIVSTFYVLALYFFKIRSPQLVLSLSLLTGCLLSHLLESIYFGSVIHYIHLAFISFNITDIIAVTSTIGGLWYFSLELKDKLPDGNKRSLIPEISLWEKKICMQIYTAHIVSSACFYLFAFIFMRFGLKHFGFETEMTFHEILFPFTIIFGSLTAFLSVLALLIGLRIAQRTQGPLRAMERYLSRLPFDQANDFVLRSSDDFQEFVPLLNRIAKSIRGE